MDALTTQAVHLHLSSLTIRPMPIHIIPSYAKTSLEEGGLNVLSGGDTKSFICPVITPCPLFIMPKIVQNKHPSNVVTLSSLGSVLVSYYHPLHAGPLSPRKTG